MAEKPHNENSEPVREQDRERAGSFSARKTLVVGLTGGVATGKTTVAAMLSKLGARVISADEVVHRMLEPGTDVYRAVVYEFGEGILRDDGTIDRSRLAELIFSDPGKRARLESIVHPPVISHLSDEADRFRRNAQGVLVLEVPLLIETSSEWLVDKVLVVTAEQETQINRLEKRYGASRGEALARIRAQLPMPEKLKHADWTVSTEGTLRDTEEQVERVWSDIQKSLAQRK